MCLKATHPSRSSRLCTARSIGSAAAAAALGLMLGFAGCQASRPASVTPPATQSAESDPGRLTLDQIEPRPQLRPQSVPSTNPSDQPALEALRLYAQARDATLGGDRLRAVGFLRDALKLDPSSFELRYSLAMALMGSPGGHDEALRLLEEAERINDNHLDLQLQLGRLYLERQRFPEAIDHLRLALQTRDFRGDEPRAAMVNLLLAHCLQQRGYWAASLEQYQRLIDRLQHPRRAVRGSAELVYHLQRPEVLFTTIGDLHEKLGRPEDALNSYRQASVNCTLPEPLIRSARVLLSLGRNDEARKVADDLVTRFASNADAVDAFREIYRRSGRDGDALKALQALALQQPAQLPLLFATADMLRRDGQGAEADRLLLAARQGHPGDLGLAQRIVNIHIERGEAAPAAAVLVEFSAANPDRIEQLLSTWQRLLRSGSPCRVKVETLLKLQVATAAQSARLYWAAVAAQADGRRGEGRALLEQAVSSQPTFAPAWRAFLSQELNRPGIGPEERRRAGQRLIDRARAQDQRALADELNGRLLMTEQKWGPAAEALMASIKGSSATSEVEFALAIVLIRAGEPVGEQLLWKIVSDDPGYDPAFQSLFDFYRYRKSLPDAEQNVLPKWLKAAPASSAARIHEAKRALRESRDQDAYALMLGAFHDEPENDDVLAVLQDAHAALGWQERFINLLEEQRLREPRNAVVADKLIRLYMARNDTARAAAIVEDSRRQSAGDTESLYRTAHLADRIDQRSLSEQILRDVLAREPRHPGASNDLGYLWAESGQKLAEAEALVRVAVESEPANASYLDSLGWVLYKQGKLDESGRMLRQALSLMREPDPVVLDHLGDVLYRLNERDQAAREWRLSLKRLESLGDDSLPIARQLRESLQDKIKKHEAGATVPVAPVAGPTATAAQPAPAPGSTTMPSHP